jgi:hypothetical protein
MLFTNDGDTIKGMRKVKQAGRFACLTLRKGGVEQTLLVNNNENGILSRPAYFLDIAKEPIISDYDIMEILIIVRYFLILAAAFYLTFHHSLTIGIRCCKQI